ncbi:site-specific DNA-methyltransferase [uncultured Granulicatella sp.]|uniref:site-specific DNA-methyltransferase n=1 Tax=uncultured Granulicatella sp. TaxID=316089 RepID=UPI0028D79778|nr:site-specific DNA-methyltransferase [uncultured Granulicatella sp.]
MKAELSNLLMNVEEFLVNGALNKNKLSELARKYDAKLLNLLMKKESVKNHFFTTLEDGVLVFKKDVFLQFLNNKEFLPDSYTAYKTKIGLGTDNGDYLSENNSVVLNFPYKDCILEGGQTKEDVKRQEVFFNEILAPNEITKLLSEKVLHNFQLIDKNGQHEVETIHETDNLVIKGNNLLALYSLKKRYAGKIKTVLIDPPYYFNKVKASDSFNYNSNFKLSTWLVFMKNRLEVARDLLSNDGFCIFIIGEEGYAHLKILSDEIFGVDKYVGTISWRKSDNQANVGEFAKVTDYILIYKKNSGLLNKLPLTEKAKKEYRYSDEKGKFRRAILLDKTRGKNYFEIITPTGKKLSGPWMKTKEEIVRLDNAGLIYWTSGGQEQPYGKIYLDNSLGQIPNDFWDNSFGTNQRGANEIRELFDDKRVFDFPKPERLIYNLLNISTNKNDIVLDFFMGSGTTQAVAHKMNRQYIGIEQMDYIETVSVERLKKVIEGEQGGISKDVEWQGGGSFVYCELKNDAQDFLKRINNALSSEELIELLKQVKKSSFLSYRVEAKKLHKEEFSLLSLADQKQLLKELIDHNNLYVNYCDIDDVDNNLSDKEKELNRQFFRELK